MDDEAEAVGRMWHSRLPVALHVDRVQKDAWNKLLLIKYNKVKFSTYATVFLRCIKFIFIIDARRPKNPFSLSKMLNREPAFGACLSSSWNIFSELPRLIDATESLSNQRFLRVKVISGIPSAVLSALPDRCLRIVVGACSVGDGLRRGGWNL